MGEVATFRLFAFMDDDELGEHDEVRVVAEWQLEDVMRWCRTRGYDHVYVTRLNGTTRFLNASPALALEHHYHG